MIRTLSTLGVLPVLTELGLDPKVVRSEPVPNADGPTVLLAGVGPDARPDARTMDAFAPWRATASAIDSVLLVLLEGARDERELARWRDGFWPAHHLVAIDRLAQNGIVERTLQGERRLKAGSGLRGDLLVLRPRSAVFDRDAVAAKFDQNAGGWNGEPGRPGWAHHRWMRHYVGTFADARGKKRILDFGSGAGWVGIEAALVATDAELCAFDPSPAMVEHARRNARDHGLPRFDARVGFGENAPYPAPGEPPFDLVLSSGVISFSGDFERFLDGLARSVASGGTLVIGDLNRESKGMRARRAARALLPLRELNAPTASEVRAWLESRGFRFEAQAGYQLTSPVPELMHFSQRRLAGLGEGLLLAWNRRAAGDTRLERFDSWVQRWTKPAP